MYIRIADIRCKRGEIIAIDKDERPLTMRDMLKERWLFERLIRECTDDKLSIVLIQVWSSIRISAFHEILKSGETLKPIAFKDGKLQDGIHRLKANLLYGNKIVEYYNRD